MARKGIRLHPADRHQHTPLGGDAYLHEPQPGSPADTHCEIEAHGDCLVLGFDQIEKLTEALLARRAELRRRKIRR